MARSVRISLKSARSLASDYRHAYDPEDREPWQREAIDELEAAIAEADEPRAPTKARPKRKPPVALEEIGPAAGARLGRAFKKAEKRERRAAIREKVFARAEVDGVPRCEGPPESDPRQDGRCVRVATELLHVFGRGKEREPESEHNCLAACAWCHRAETQNRPDGASWWRFFANLFSQRGWTRPALLARQRAEFDNARSSLPASPRVRP